MLTRRTNAVTGRGIFSALAVYTALLSGQPVLGQDSGTVTVDVARCVELESAAARRECFGAQVDEALGQRAETAPDDDAPDVNASDRDQTPVPGRGDDQREADQEELFGTIVDLQERLPNAYVITLDNGQVWQQIEPKMYPLQPGLDVRLVPSAFGNSYRLIVVGRGHNIQVRRIQ